MENAEVGKKISSNSHDQSATRLIKDPPENHLWVIGGLLLKYYYYFYKIDSGRMFSLVFIVLGSGLQQVTTGPRSLFSFFLQGQYFP